MSSSATISFFFYSCFILARTYILALLWINSSTIPWNVEFTEPIPSNIVVLFCRIFQHRPWRMVTPPSFTSFPKNIRTNASKNVFIILILRNHNGHFYSVRSISISPQIEQHLHLHNDHNESYLIHSGLLHIFSTQKIMIIKIIRSQSFNRGFLILLIISGKF